MSASLSTEGRAHRLRAFRLSEIPYDIRKRALSIALGQSDRALPDEQSGYGGLLAKLSVPAPSFNQRKALELAAERPSERVYFVTVKAWEKVMGDADAA
jgi:hypothetical protein